METLKMTGLARGPAPLRLLKAPPSPLAALFGAHGRPRHGAVNGALRLENEPALELYRVEIGVLRCVAFTADGRRCITRFAGEGEAVGLETEASWSFGLEAVEETELLALPRPVFEAAMERDPGLRRELRHLVGLELRRRERQLRQIACMSAQDRLLSFLRDYAAERRPLRGWSRLPMTRADIGDHVGLSLETVSRVLGLLRRQGLIDVEGPHAYRLTPLGIEVACAA